MSACHAKFKKHAPIIKRAYVDVDTLGPPQVSLGQSDGDSLGAAAINIMQAVKGSAVARDIAAAVDTEKMNARFEAVFVEQLGDGPPFAASQNDKGSLVAVEVLSWGMSVPQIGMQGTFDYSVRVRVYMPDGKRVYTNRESCSVLVGNPEAFATAVGAVNNKKQIDEMSKKGIRQAFHDAARDCAVVVVNKMRQHAG